MSKELTTNKAIQALVSNFDGYIGNMNDRLKIHAFFNEFDDKARSDLMNLVKISNNRYKCVKSGNNLDTVINKQAQTYRQLANRVLKDEFYTTDDVYNEAKKVKNLRSNRNQKEIAELRMKIKHSNRMIKNPISAEVKSSFQKKFTEGVSKVPSGRRRHLYQPLDTHHHTLDRTVKFFDSSMRRASIKNNKPEETEPQEQVKNQCKYLN